MKQVVLKIHPKDNVLVALRDIAKEEAVSYNGEEYIAQEKIPAKHKMFTKDMYTGDKVIMYGVLVGKMQQEVDMGGLMTTANAKHAADPYEYRPFHYEWHAPDVSKFKGRTFNGYHRKDG